MNKIIYTDKQKFDKIFNKIKQDGFDKLHILADFDKTLTTAFLNGEKRHALISVLEQKGYLGEKYSKTYREYFEYYYPFEIDSNLSKEEKSVKMREWWRKVNDLLIENKLNKNDITKIINDGIIDFRDGALTLFNDLEINKIPVVIISANGLGGDAVKIFFELRGVKSKNISIISNTFIWDKNNYAVGYEEPVIHTFNKDETVLKEFPEIYEKVENRKNVILLGDSLGDPHMIDGFEYDNLLKIGFLNDKEDELLESYKEKYDVIITGDGDINFMNELMKKLK